MKTITLTLAVTLDSLASVIDALSNLNGVETITVGERTTAPDAKAWAESFSAGRIAAQPVKVQRRDAGTTRRTRTVYTLGKRITPDKIKSLASLTDTMRTVALYIAKHEGKVGMRDVQRAFDGKINAHTVDGTIYQLRKHTPAVIVSTQAE